MRFAQVFRDLKPYLRDLGRAAIPHGGELAVSVLPNLISAGMTANMQPPGTDMGGRIGAGAEDLAGGLVLQTLGRGLGYGSGRALKRAFGGSLPPRLMDGLQLGAEVSTEMLGWPFLPRPFADQNYHKYEAQAEDQRQQEQAYHDAMVAQKALSEAGALGMVMPPGMRNSFYGDSVSTGLGGYS